MRSFLEVQRQRASTTRDAQPLPELGDLGAHHLVLLGLERQELVHGVDAQHLARPVDLGVQHPDESVAHQDRVREEAVSCAAASA